MVLLISFIVVASIYGVQPRQGQTVKLGARSRSTSPWQRKATKIADISRASLPGGDLEAMGDETNIGTAGKVMGFSLKLPKSSKAAAAGPAKIFGARDIEEYVSKQGAAPRPGNPREDGVATVIKYPNGFEIYLRKSSTRKTRRSITLPWAVASTRRETCG